MAHHCSTFSVAFLRDLYCGAAIVCPRAVFVKLQAKARKSWSLHFGVFANASSQNFNQGFFLFFSCVYAVASDVGGRSKQPRVCQLVNMKSYFTAAFCCQLQTLC